MGETYAKAAFREKMSRFIQSIDDRVKLFITILIGTVAFVCANICSLLLLSIVTFILGWFCGLRKSLGITLTIWFILGPMMWGINLISILGPFVPGAGLFILVVKFTPMFIMMIVVYATLNVSRFLYTLEKTGLPKGFTVPLGVSIRFVPSLTEEFRHIRSAMRFRGIDLSFGNVIRRPLATIEYILVPLLMRALSISDELARTALTRAIDNPGPKTSLQAARFKSADALVALIWIVFMVLLVYIDHLFQKLPL